MTRAIRIFIVVAALGLIGAGVALGFGTGTGTGTQARRPVRAVSRFAHQPQPRPAWQAKLDRDIARNDCYGFMRDAAQARGWPVPPRGGDCHIKTGSVRVPLR